MGHLHGHVRWRGESCEISIPVPGKTTKSGHQKYHYEYPSFPPNATVAEKKAIVGVILADLNKKFYRGESFTRSNLTVLEMLKQWEQQYVDTVVDLKPKTRRWYNSNLKNHLFEAPFAQKRATELSAFDLDDLYKDKIQAGLSARTVRGIHATMSAALNWAKGETIKIVTLNVAEAAHPPALRKLKYRTLEPKEVRAFLRANEGWPIYPIIFTFLTTGLRNSELRALRKEDLDFAKKRLRVDEQIGEGSVKTPNFDETKTEDSDAWIPMIPALEPVLKAALAARARERTTAEAADDDYVDYGLVFANLNGRPWVMSTLNREFKRALERAKLPRTIHPHLLRHGVATLLFEMGVDTLTVAMILRHSDPNTARKIYTHPSLKPGREALSKMERVLGTPRKKPVLKRQKNKTS